jgi:hypothetical protein
MTNNKNILANFTYTHWNVNDTARNLDVVSSLIPRKTHISGHFHLMQRNLLKFHTHKQQIFN